MECLDDDIMCCIGMDYETYIKHVLEQEEAKKIKEENKVQSIAAAKVA